MAGQHWTQGESKSLADTQDSLKVVDGLLSFMSGGVGKPSNNERSLFAATVVFAYGVWESFVEQIAIELAARLSAEIAPSRVPEFVHTRLEKKADSTWALAVSPGWRALWVSEVERAALGDDKSFGLNTAGEGQVTALMKLVGIDDPFARLPKTLVPDHLWGTVASPLEALDRLVRLRGEIVHTAQIPKDLRKPHARQWRDFVDDLINRVDQNCRTQARQLLGL
jgi:hypothetical protein